DGLADKRLARDLGMPVHEGSAGILLPGPDVESVEGRESEAVGSFEVVKDLSAELGSDAGMLGVPRVGKGKGVGAGEFEAAVGLRFIKDDLGPHDVNDAVANQGVVHVVQAHSSRVGSADAAELEVIALALGDFDVLEAGGGLPHHLDQRARAG